MAEINPEITRPAAAANEPAIKRVHSYSRLTTALAVLGLATAGYALLRLDATHDRLDQANDTLRQVQIDQQALRVQLASLTTRERQRRKELARQIMPLVQLPKQLQDISAALEELQGRTAGPQRAWSRAEALYLTEIAQRSLTLHRDVETAVAALQSADARLASLRDPGVSAVRQQLAREVQALRSVNLPDSTGIVARLASAEEQAGRAPLKGIVATGRTAHSPAILPEGFLARARAIAGNALSALLSIRKVDDHAGSIVTLDAALVRRQHLQLLLFTARSAVARHDGPAYRSALAGARQWLGEFFDLSAPVSRTLLAEVQALEPVNIDPALPSIAASARLLQQMAPSPAVVQ